MSVQPITEIRNRLNGFVPGVQSKVEPDAPTGVLFPGDPGIGIGIAKSDNAFMPRIGFAWDSTGKGQWAVRSAYGVFYDQFQKRTRRGFSGSDQFHSVGPVQSVQRTSFAQFR